jgi:hypothetical protein
VAEAELFFERVHDFDVRDDLMRECGRRGRDEGELLPREFSAGIAPSDERRFHETSCERADWDS